MKCVRCQKEIAKWEEPQVRVIQDGKEQRKVWPPALCDACARAVSVRRTL